ncbi:MAG: FecR domain-containing protein [Hyphomicrobiales bacterium]|nr:FecR domain-containing protein [Hyphomicrobiales bacterium]MBV8439138.1 FecR domain-containing protein [Hyphomicrobiales bacterium]
MLKREPTPGRKLFAALLVATGLIGSPFAGSQVAWAVERCTLSPYEHDASLKVLRCGESLVVRSSRDAKYEPLAPAGGETPTAIELDDGALLIEFHPSAQQREFQILTPLAIAAVRGTKWAVEVTAARTSTLVFDGAVSVANRRLRQSVVLTKGQGVDVTPSDTSVVRKQWGDARIQALLSRLGE